MMRKREILVIEDDLDIRENIAEFLESEGYQVQSAVDGRHGLDALLSSERLPMVILLDLMMPRMNGIQFREEQLKNERIASVPVVLMSADSQIEAKQLKIGATSFIKKPIDIEALSLLLKRFS